MGRQRGAAKRIKPGSKPTKATLYTEDVLKEETRTADGTRGLNAKNGDLPLLSSFRLANSHQVDKSARQPSGQKREKGKGSGAGHGRSTDVSTDVPLSEHVETGWPLGHQEIATCASSFRFELDCGRLQAMLQANGGSFRSMPGGSFRSMPGGSFRSMPSGSFRSVPDGSFRFRNGAEVLSAAHLPPGSHLKPPRQMERPSRHGSNRFVEGNASMREANSRSNDSTNLQGGNVVAAPSSNGSLKPFEARNNVAVDVPNSPDRSVILQRLRDSKPASPRLGLDDDVSYHKELAKLNAGRDDGLNQWLNPSSPLWKGDSPARVKAVASSPLWKGNSPARVKAVASSPLWKGDSPTRVKAVATKESTTELPTMPTLRKQSSHSPSPLRESAPAQERAPVTPPSSRFRNDKSSRKSLQEHILSIDVQSLHVNTTPSPDRMHFVVPAAIPVQWEEQPVKSKSIRLSRKLSRESVEEIINDKEILPSTEVIDITGISADGRIIGMSDGDCDALRTESHRYYGKVQHSRQNSREASLGQSSRRYNNEKRIDLDASAAAKFLVEQYESTPLSTPGRDCSSPAFAVPFKWEDAPGKAKVVTPAQTPNLLQLPPRLSMPSYRNAESFGRVSHPLAGFFAPCITGDAASSPGRKNSEASSKSLAPPWTAPSPHEQRQKRPGLVARCSSLPQEGCQIIVSRSTVSSPALKPSGRDFFSSPTSILNGLDGSSSQTSVSNLMFSSGDLEDFAPQTSKSTSYTSIEEDFADVPSSSSSSLPLLKTDPPRSRLLGAPVPSTPTSTLLKAPPPRHGDPEYQPTQSQGLNEAQPSPQRPTRLPYTMPSVAEQVLASCGEAGRRQLIQELSPRFLRQFSGRRLPRHGNSSPASRVERSTAADAEEGACSPSPAYAAALELLSPAVHLMVQRQKGRSPAKPPLAKPRRRRPHFMLSICRKLKRVMLGRHRRCKPIEPKLMMYRDALPSTTNQFYKLN